MNPQGPKFAYWLWLEFYVLKHPLGTLMEIWYLLFSGVCPRVFPGCTVLVCMGWPGVDRDQSYGRIKIVLQTEYFHGAISSKYHHNCINPAPPLSSSTQYARDLSQGFFQLIFNWQWKCYGQCHISYFSWKWSTLFKSSLIYEQVAKILGLLFVVLKLISLPLFSCKV